MLKLILLSALCASCGTMTKTQVLQSAPMADIILNIPSYHETLMNEELEQRACFVAKKCTATWSPYWKAWVLHRVPEETK